MNANVDVGWVLTLLGIISASGPVLSVVLDYRNRKRQAISDAGLKDADANVKLSEASYKRLSEQELSQKVISLNDERWITRERRWAEREEAMEQEIAQLRGEIEMLRNDMTAYLEYIANDEQWHFYDRMSRIQAGLPEAHARTTFQQFMEARKASTV
ncbi:hypothetical protein GJ25_gp042 [Mycobacterium phage Hawkeye]|uniref:Uncharacterized protein n=1 Tax=Mycobacterium phage Hawkeye TaxID=1458711 RepID=X2KRH6_9CAUD|nr:hypothetical protein GJ25_gp042 [Mycobacterium phage Hawkeye]AHN84053.1 hypothetical protein PBI_HAWKEYE_42 [Mycobacterium phage Hawkeye]